MRPWPATSSAKERLCTRLSAHSASRAGVGCSRAACARKCSRAPCAASTAAVACSSSTSSVRHSAAAPVAAGSAAAYARHSALLLPAAVAASSARASRWSAGPSEVSPSVTHSTADQGSETTRSPVRSAPRCTTSPRPSAVCASRTCGSAGSAPAWRHSASNCVR